MRDNFITVQHIKELCDEATETILTLKSRVASLERERDFALAEWKKAAKAADTFLTDLRWAMLRIDFQGLKREGMGEYPDTYYKIRRNYDLFQVPRTNDF